MCVVESNLIVSFVVGGPPTRQCYPQQPATPGGPQEPWKEAIDGLHPTRHSPHCIATLMCNKADWCHIYTASVLLFLLHPFPLLCGVVGSYETPQLTLSCANSPDNSLSDKLFLMLLSNFGLPHLLSRSTPITITLAHIFFLELPYHFSTTIPLADIENYYTSLSFRSC